MNQKREPVSLATVVVQNSSDSQKTQTKIADSLGLVVFNLTKGNYRIKISAVNYRDIEKEIAVTNNQTFFNFTTEETSKTLSNVTITSQKPLMKQEDDKTIIDPENLAASSTSSYEVIEKTPGLFVDQDGNIYINSLTPATVYINGREMKMSASDVATMLKSLPPNAISKIEILRTPSAKYDASGSGGIVNVVLKKGIKIGLTGSVNGGWQQGTYANEFIGFNLNNSDGKKFSYINVNYSNRNNYERIKTDRLFALDSVLSQDALTKYPSDVYYTGYGIGYELNKKWSMDFDGNISLNDFNNRSENKNLINKISTAQNLTDNLNHSNNNGSALNISNGFEIKLKIDSLGSEWTNSLFYSYSKNKSNQVFSTIYYFPIVPVFGGDGSADNTRNYFFATSDLKLKLKKMITFETGVKSSVNNYNNTSDYFRETNGTRSKDNARTNTFKYKENINALYLQGTKTIKDIVIKVGTRLENTNMNGRQIIPSDTSFTIHRTDLFPYIYLSKKVMTIAGFELRAYLVYRRTISRPVYDQLNPFPRYVDQYLSEAGNPGLRPQFTKNYEANISVNERPILAIG
ncbi:MAG: outer membrane beta-barrel protein, partial [Bacteroidota bacterium]